MTALNRVATTTASLTTPAEPSDIGRALRDTGVLNLSGNNAKYASAQWLSAPVRTIASLTHAEVIICKVKGYKTLGDIMALRVAWVPHFGETLGLKLLCVQNALRPVLMTHGRPKA